MSSPKNDGFVDVRSPEGRLLFRYHPLNRIIEIKQKNGPVKQIDLMMIDIKLRQVKAPQSQVVLNMQNH